MKTFVALFVMLAANTVIAADLPVAERFHQSVQQFNTAAYVELTKFYVDQKDYAKALQEARKPTDIQELP